MSTPDLSRFDQFLAISTEDIQARAKLALTRADLDSLHTSAVKGEVTWEYYHAVNNARYADNIYRKEGQRKGWTISDIREQVGRIAYRQHSHNGEHIHEWLYGKFWPVCLCVERIRSSNDPIKIVHEIEYVFSQDDDIELRFKGLNQTMEMAAIELLQKFPDNQSIQDVCFLTPECLTAQILIRAGEHCKVLLFPIGLRYEPLLRKLSGTYKLDPAKEPNKPLKETLQLAKTEELREALAGLWTGIKRYDVSREIPFPGYIEKQVAWHLGDEFERQSSEIDGKRMLKGQIERTGGSLDDVLPRCDEDGLRTLGDTIEDPQASFDDRRALLNDIYKILTDETDRKIFSLMRQGLPQIQVAKQLKMTQPAVAQRLKRIGKNHPA